MTVAHGPNGERPERALSAEPFINDSDFRLYVGDVRDVLATLAPGSVDCCITSPPYWGLRDYGTGQWEGGDPNCDHTVGGQVQDNKAPGAITTGQRPGVDSSKCRKCGATRQDRQLGLEATPEEYVANMVAVFREVRRVLSDHGTCWLNLGDSYTSNPGSGQERGNLGGLAGADSPRYQATMRSAHSAADERKRTGLKPKDLVGIPWRVAFALQADGWYLRSDIIWSKPNPMPESVTDRPTKSHEYVFLLSKRPRYFFDQEAVREAYTPDDRLKRVHDHKVSGSHENHDGMTNGRERWANTGRNIRSVWEIATQPYPEAHFATYPEKLVERCLLAGCPEGGTVLDPFMGSGTTALVARKHGRHAVGVELSQEYSELCARRLQQLSLLA